MSANPVTISHEVMAPMDQREKLSSKIGSGLLSAAKIVGLVALAAIIVVGGAFGLVMAGLYLPLLVSVLLIPTAIVGAILIPALFSGEREGHFQEECAKHGELE